MTKYSQRFFRQGSAVLISVFFILMTGLLSYPVFASSFDEIPVAAQVVLDKAAKLMAKEDYDSAIEILTSFQSRGPKIMEPGKVGPKGYHHPMVYFFMGNCCLMKKDYASAQRYYSRSVEGDPGFAGAWLNLARTYYDLHNYAGAAQCFKSAYEKSDPKTPDSLYYCALGYLMAGQYETSIPIFQRLFKNHPEAITLRWKENYVQALIGAGRSKEALPLIRELAEKSTGKDKTRWQEMLLYQYLQLDMTNEALAYATWLARSDRNNTKWWKALVHIRLSGGQYKEALAALTIYGYLTPFSLEEKKLYADLNMQLNIPAKAADQYYEIMSDAPDDTTLCSLILAYQRQNRYKEAFDLITRYAPDSENVDLLMLKGDLLYSLKRYSEAGQTYQQVARSENPKAGRAWLMAGYAAWQCDDIKGSLYAFERASRDSRHHNAAISAIKDLDNIN